MLTEIDAHKLSLESKRSRAKSHGWNVTALPLTASIGERLKVKARGDDELGDQADEILMLSGIAANEPPDDVA